jgi:peptidoglycan/LPS O-acetylase OafA/YrhL
MTGRRFDPAAPNNLDLVRFIAATMVLVDHSDALTGRPPLPAPFGYETLGGLAVAMFFAISGFLVSASWERRPAVLAFARKRALRIVPAYALVVIVCALALGSALSPLAPREYLTHPQTRGYLMNLTFVQIHYALPLVFATNPYPHAVNGSIWTLPIEVAMYVALALLGALRLLSRASVTVLVAALALVWFAWNPHIGLNPLFGLDVLPAAYTLHLALWFFIGSAFWFWRDRISYRTDVAIALAVVCWLAGGRYGSYLLLHLALPYVLLAFATLDVKWMAHFGQRGDFSYGIYLWAFPMQQTLVHFGGAAWPYALYVCASFAVTLGCAFVSWHVVEHPALRHKRAALRVEHRPAAGTIAP